VLVEQAHRLGIAPAEVAGRYVLALAAAQAARRAEVERHLSDWAALLTAGPEAPLKAASVRAHLALAGHDLPAATALLDDAIGPVLPHASAAPLHEFGLWALLRTVVGDRDEPARATLRALPAVLRRANRAALTFAEAVAAGRAGRPQEAGTLFAEAEAELAGQPWLRRVLRLLALESAVGDGWGDPVPLLRAALAEHERFGEEASARTCRDLLRRAGAPTRRGRGTATVPSGLARLGVTTREMDVLVLLADGATNAEIAARLFLSSRTVETHVANLMLKTGAGSRHDLGRLAQRELR
jgi:DNA-binding CsgD family transcriptional regulator